MLPARAGPRDRFASVQSNPIGTLGVNAVDLKNVLRKINTNRDNFVHRTAPISRWFMKTTILAPRCLRVGAVHCIKSGLSPC